jgi:tetratricopeptide (TPR) repeat protein
METIEPERGAGDAAWPYRWAVWAAVLAVALAAAAGATWWWWPRPQLVADPVADREPDIDEWQPTAAVAPGYLGPRACAPCHANRVAEFGATRHFQACAVPEPGTMPAGFAPGKGHFATRDPALRFEMTQTGPDFFQVSLQGKPPDVKRTPARIALAYGWGGVLDQVYFTWHDDRLYELPMVWLQPQGRWAMVSFNPYGPGGDFGRTTTPRCLECHNTWVEHVPGTSNRYRQGGMILGVTCEKCHGPGRDHVAFHEAHPKADTPQAVVRPALLARERQLEVCTQCHGNAIVPLGPAFRYRPGEPLAASYRTTVTEHPENDHVANQVQYLRRSKCFQKSELTCVTCHNPHRPHEPDKPGAGARSCLKCHKPADCGERDRVPAAVRDDCVGCHMAPRVWMNVHFHTEDDRYLPPIRRYQHHIAVDPVARQEVLLAWYQAQPDEPSRHEADRLRKALVGHWLAEADRRRGEHRWLAAIGALREALHLDPAPAVRAELDRVIATQTQLDDDLVAGMHEVEQRRFGRAVERLTRVLAVKPDYAVAHAKIGTAYAGTGQPELARKHLEAVARYDPDDPYGFMMLGWLAYLRGAADEAVAHYRKADEADPYSAKVHYHWGLALTKLGRFPEAAEHFGKALTIDPDHAGACQALSDALRRSGRPVEAVGYAKRAARLTDQGNADVLLTLAEAYAAAGHPVRARDTAARALQVAPASNPELVPEIRWRLEELRELARKSGG